MKAKMKLYSINGKDIHTHNEDRIKIINRLKFLLNDITVTARVFNRLDVNDPKLCEDIIALREDIIALRN